MSVTHPFISGAGNVAQMVRHLRKSFPATITADTVKKLGLAPNNESYLINVLQFIGVIDEKGKKVSETTKVFSHQKDEDFSKYFEALIKKAYSALFDLHGDDSWDLAGDELITFFRQNDQTSANVGKRQASTFKILAGLSGHGKLPASRGGKVKKTASSKKKTSKTSAKLKENATPPGHAITNSEGNKNIGLTVRIEINLPADGSKETYDNIFKSIKENLINA